MHRSSYRPDSNAGRADRSAGRRQRRHVARGTRRGLGSALAATGLLAGMWCSVGAAELPLTRVVLSTAGLAQFTHAGGITGGSTADLAVRLDQVDDILKSLTVFDRQGAVGAVTLPGKAPLAELFRDLPFGPDALQSPTLLLNALVGSEVEVTGPVNARGRVFRVAGEEVALPNNGGTTTRHRLALMTDKGMVQAILEEATALRFTDPQAVAQIERALAGLADNRAKDRRRLSIGFLGQGTRPVALSYVVAAPVWKTAYRLVLPKEVGKARLQGWAVVENLTGGDWKEVDLVLTSGNPVALRQSLYTAFFADRPEIEVATAARLTPRLDEASDEPRAPAGPRRKAKRATPERPPIPAAAPLAQAQRAGAVRPAPAPAVPAEDVIGAAVAAAEAEEAATQLIYRFPTKVSLATGHTMMVPFVDREVTAARTWLYQPDTSERHPLAAVRVRNDGDSGLPPGIVTTYDAGGNGQINYVGDAQLPLMPTGMFKYVVFALDTRTAIRREDRGIQRTTLGKAVNGVLTLTARSRRVIDYEVTAPADEDREIVVEEERASGWKPAAESKEAEETPAKVRYRIAAPKGKTTKASLAIERSDTERVVLTSLAPDAILARIRGLQNESAELKDAVTQLGALVADINKARSQRTRNDAERKKIADDQERIRRNLQAVGQGSDLGRQYIDTLKAQEGRLAEIGRSDEALDREIAAKRQAAEQVAQKLTL